MKTTKIFRHISWSKFGTPIPFLIQGALLQLPEFLVNPLNLGQIVNNSNPKVRLVDKLYNETKLDILRKGSFANYSKKHNLTLFFKLFNEAQLVSLLPQKETALMAIGHFTDSRDYVRGRNIKSTLIFWQYAQLEN